MVSRRTVRRGGPHLPDARAGVARIADTIRGFRRFAQAPDDGEFAVDLTDCVRLAGRLVEAELQPRADLVLDLGIVPLVRANEGRLVHVLVNLLMHVSSMETRDVPAWFSDYSRREGVQ